MKLYQRSSSNPFARLDLSRTVHKITPEDLEIIHEYPINGTKESRSTRTADPQMLNRKSHSG
jgi:hypothetical protein